MDLISLQLRAAEADDLRVKLTEAKLALQQAKTLMLEMDERHKKLKRDRANLRMLVWNIRRSKAFFLLPRSVKSWLIDWDNIVG